MELGRQEEEEHGSRGIGGIGARRGQKHRPLPEELNALISAAKGGRLGQHGTVASATAAENGGSGKRGTSKRDVVAWLSVLETRMDALNPFELSWLVWSCGKLLSRQPRRGQDMGLGAKCAAVQLAAVRLLTANRAAGEGLQLQGFNAIHFSQLMVGFAHARYLPDEQFREAMAEAIERLSHPSGFSPRAAANVLWAAATLHWSPPVPVLGGLVDRVVQLAEKANCQPVDLSHSLWALGVMAEDGVHVPINPAQQQLLVDVFTGMAAGAEPHAVSSVMLGLAKIGHAAALRPYSWARLVAAMVAKSGEAEPRQLSNTLWALGRAAQAGVQVPIDDDQQQRLVDAFLRMPAELKPQEASNVLWALAHIGRAAALRQECWPKLVAAVVAHNADAKPQAFSNTLWALGKLAEEGVRVRIYFKEQQQLVDAFIATAAEDSPQGVANVLLGLAKLGRGVALRPHSWDLLLAELVARRDEANSQELANALWAVAKMAEDGVEVAIDAEWQQLLVDAFLSRHAKATPQAVSMVLWALAGLGQAAALRPDTWGHFEVMLLDNLGGATARVVAISLWSLAKLAEDGAPVPLGEAVQALVADFVSRGDTEELDWEQVRWAAPRLGVSLSDWENSSDWVNSHDHNDWYLSDDLQ